PGGGSRGEEAAQGLPGERAHAAVRPELPDPRRRRGPEAHSLPPDPGDRSPPAGLGIYTMKHCHPEGGACAAPEGSHGYERDPSRHWHAGGAQDDGAYWM